MIKVALICACVALAIAAPAASANEAFCLDCVEVRVGPPMVIRGPFPDELDAVFSALRLPDGNFRGFSANGATYAIDGPALPNLSGARRAVMEPGSPGSPDDCGRWLTSIVRSKTGLLGFVHQEHACDYDQGRTEKSMAMAISNDDGLNWTDLGNVITGRDLDRPEGTTGEGDCTMIDGRDGYLYGYCLRASDYQTIVARAPLDDPTHWTKYFEGGWTQPGLGGRSSDIGFVGIGVGYLEEPGLVIAIATDPWFAGLRLSVSEDKRTFADLKEPLLPIDGSDWARPADTDLLAYTTMLNPETGSTSIGSKFLLAYTYVPAGKGFESRYLVFNEVSLSVAAEPMAVQVGAALTRWVDAERTRYVTSTAPTIDEKIAYVEDAFVAYTMTKAPEGVASVKLVECASDQAGQMLAEDGQCGADGYRQIRMVGWLYTSDQPGSVPVYQCLDAQDGAHFASSKRDCEGLGTMKLLLGYGMAR